MGKFIRANNTTTGISFVGGTSSTHSDLLTMSNLVDVPDSIYGSAADGSVTFDGSSTVLSMAPASSVYTMTRDIYCYNLTLSANVRLNPAGYRIFVQNLLTFGSGSTIGFTTGFSTAGSIQQGGAANNVSLSPVTHSLGGSSATYNATAPTAATGGTNYYKQPFQAIKGYSITGSSTTPTFLKGGAGGTAGAGGGVVILAARFIGVSSGTGYIKAPGTAGAGGGGGGVIIIISSAATLNSGVSTDVTGGTSCVAGTVIYSQVA
jgi:hypothetical protein